MQSRDIFTWVLSLLLISFGVLAQAQDGNTDVTNKIQQLETGLAQVMQDLKEEENYLLSVLTGQQTLLANNIDKLSSEMNVLRNAIINKLNTQNTALTEATKKLWCEINELKVIAGLNTTYLNNKTYYFSYDQPRMTWYEADNFCRSHGMQLVTVETRAEWELLKPEVNKLCDKIGHWPWSSGSDAAEEGKWKWTVSGSDVIYFGGRYSSFTNAQTHNCLQLYSAGWDDENCSLKLPFICELNSAC